MQRTQPLRLIFFDLEGTLFRKVLKDSTGDTAPSAWSLLARHLGPEAAAEEEETKVKWTAGGYAGYVEWMEDTIRIHQKYGLNRCFFESVMSAAQYHPGVEETFACFHRHSVRTAVISGGFKAQADRAARELKIHHVFAACEYYWDDAGQLVWWNLLPCDYEGKKDFMRLIMQEHGFAAEQCAFVGDGRNDIALAGAVGTSISFNGAAELAAVCTAAVEQPEGKEDFRTILPLLGLAATV
ncbi:MAG TPA: HAD-IB family phosphatase [Oligoflexia bacterium]|nr:HAD-IB family phosphatase [Oligoflexia bacterium]